ncbi:DUF3870 domain-containing protein [Clostridium sp. D2Q-11]|uniref:DUF3870 domain-containing protein n=1 Tax=Anaeromonas frigoriresistens TaxID=2683708 RepID=A0A942Z8H3_9FIRM|nr:DUF3870 domain-containing protein [Anaeromonas frigoriresistens]MBS4537920.1 DUF3870 domain-containing protein [Anaeromonas frigoriresistens]
MYDKNTVYVVGHGKTTSDNAITERFKMFFIGFVIDSKTDEIVDLSCSATIPTTQEFIANIFVGKKMDKYRGEIEKEIIRRYFGSSQKAIIVSYKDAVKKYNEAKNKHY